MRLEQLLSDQGVDPLTDQLNGRALRAFINANLKRVGVEAVEVSTPSDVILERIYSIDNPDVQTKILERTVAELKGNSNYKKMSMYSAVALTAIVGMLFIDSIMGGHISPEAIEVVKTIVGGLLSILTSNTP